MKILGGIRMVSLTSGSASWIGIIIFYVVFLGGLMYFMAIRPQKKQQKKVSDLIASMEIGDFVLTSSGFYGTIIDINDDTVNFLIAQIGDEPCHNKLAAV